MIYFDNAATTKPYLESLKVFEETSVNDFYNPSALYSVSLKLSKEIAETKQKFLRFLDAKSDDRLIFTSGATESNNLAVLGSCFYKNKKYLFSFGEHPSVFNCALELKNKGYKVEFIPLQKNGQIDYDKFEKMLDKDVYFVSILFVNNETGAINDLKRIRKILDEKAPDSIFHVDAVQAFSKIDFSISKVKINLCSISSHKIGGIKGIGALFVSKNTKIKSINFGGEQQEGLRSGTVSSASIISFLNATEISFKNKEKDFEKVSKLKERLILILKKYKDKIKIISDNDCSPFIISLYFENRQGETFMRFLDSNGILISRGSACSSNHIGNRVLEKMGLNKKQIMGAVRLSFGHENTLSELSDFESVLNDYFNSIDN